MQQVFCFHKILRLEILFGERLSLPVTIRWRPKRTHFVCMLDKKRKKRCCFALHETTLCHFTDGFLQKSKKIYIYCRQVFFLWVWVKRSEKYFKCGNADLNKELNIWTVCGCATTSWPVSTIGAGVIHKSCLNLCNKKKMDECSELINVVFQEVWGKCVNCVSLLNWTGT